jgi:hypothetical protein
VAGDTSSATPLVCPSCGSTFPEPERFCPDCKLPLTLERPPGGLGPVSDRHAWARKIKPQLAEGSLVRVAGARNQAPDFSRPAVVTPGRLLIGLLIALAVGAAIVWAVAELVG